MKSSYKIFSLIFFSLISFTVQAKMKDVIYFTFSSNPKLIGVKLDLNENKWTECFHSNGDEIKAISSTNRASNLDEKSVQYVSYSLERKSLNLITYAIPYGPYKNTYELKGQVGKRTLIPIQPGVNNYLYFIESSLDSIKTGKHTKGCDFKNW